MLISAPRETEPLERRVSLTPDVVARLTSAGYEVAIEAGAGARAYFSDDEYLEAGARISTSADDLWGADVVSVVSAPVGPKLPGPKATLLGLLAPLDDPAAIERLAADGATLLAFELVPRTTRAQAMDALSSQATAAGYEAVLVAAEHSPKFFPMLTTAAGTVPPARVLVLGAGVAGLQAIATARRLGARVSGYDVRAAAREQVESLGAAFIELDLEAQDASASGGYARALAEDDQARQLRQLAPHVQQADVIITTAAIPGRRAPLLVTAEMVENLHDGTVIVDGAASTGGNCELTQPDVLVEHAGVVILGPTDLASRVPAHASQMYARNMLALVEYISTPEGLELDRNDEIVAGCLVAEGGKIVHPRVADRLGGAR
jgi:NAD(P) transhydrogenase subunit alpha